MRDLKFKFVLRNGDDKKVVSRAYTLEEICQTSDIYDSVYVDLETEHGCDGNCTTEANQFCECGGVFDEYSVIAKLESTGLSDKNGKPVYEGDVVTNPHDTKPRHVIEWNEAQAGFMLSGSCMMMSFQLGEFWEVIGNIHQHPHLLP